MILSRPVFVACGVDGVAFLLMEIGPLVQIGADASTGGVTTMETDAAVSALIRSELK